MATNHQRETTVDVPKVMATTAAASLALGYPSMPGPPLLSNELDALLREVARGDSTAFAAVYDLTRSRVYGLVTRVLRDPGYSEETTQEVYLQVWRKASSYNQAAGSALAWLLTL